MFVKVKAVVALFGRLADERNTKEVMTETVKSSYPNIYIYSQFMEARQP